MDETITEHLARPRRGPQNASGDTQTMGALVLSGISMLLSWAGSGKHDAGCRYAPEASCRQERTVKDTGMETFVLLEVEGGASGWQ